MTKRKHEEEVEDIVLSDKSVPSGAAAPTPGGRQMQGQGDDKHTIDSDDEEEEREKDKKFDRLKDDDIEGQEDNTMNFDGDIQITPFNLKEEQQEGSFSADGNFVWNDKKDEIKDAWLDDIDWVKVKERTAADLARKEEEDEVEEEQQEKYSEITAYRDILVMLKPNESVAKALRRLGGNKKAMSASERWKKKKAGVTEDPQEKLNKEIMLKLSGLADSILTRSGNMEVYEETYESISFKLEQEEGKSKTELPEGIDDEDALDMFAGNLDDSATKETGRADVATGSKSAPNGSSTEKSGGGDALTLVDEVMWEFKWQNEEGEEVHGPHSSQKMLDWQESGFFQAGVWCRKVGTGAEFSTSKRIDFDLYT